MDFKVKLKNAFKQQGFTISDSMAEQFLIYKNLLLLWNEKVNLTAITDEDEIITKHFADSLALATAVDVENTRIADIGTGAGFPGIPIKICYPSTEILLVDSLGKRVNFLNEVIMHLQLKQISAIHARAEDIAVHPLRESFDICVSRAVSRLNVVLEYAMPLVSVGGRTAILKGNNISEEITESAAAISVLGGELENVKTVRLPNSDIAHKIVVVKKISQTPLKFPRKSKKISQHPII